MSPVEPIVSTMSAKAVVENHLKTGGEHIEDKNKLTVSNQVSTACFDTFQEMKIRKKHRYIIFKLGEEEIEIETVGDRDQVSFSLHFKHT